MAEIIYGSQVSENGFGTNYTPTVMPVGYVDGDMIVAYMSQDVGDTALSCATTGWVRAGTRTGTPVGAAYGQFFYTIVSGGTFNAPTFTGRNDDWSMIAFIVRDADTTTPLDVVSAQTDWNTVGNAAAATPTSTTDGCLVLHGWTSDGPIYFRNAITDSNLAYQLYGVAVSAAVSFRQQEAAGVVPASQMYFSTAAEGGTQWTVCIRNKSGGKLQPDVRVDADVVSLYGMFSAASAPIAWKGPEEATKQFAGGFTAGALGGITVTTGAITTSTTGNTATAINTSTTDNRWDGAWHDYSANLDGRMFSVELATSRDGSLSGGRIGTGGYVVGFTDGTNYEFFRALSVTKMWSLGLYYRASLVCGTTTPLYSRGTLDWTAITGICYLLHHKNTAVDTLSVRYAYVVDNVILTGGSSNNPLSTRDLYLATAQNQIVDFAKLQSSAQVQSQYVLQIGDGTNTTHFKNTAVSTEFPQAWSDTVAANWQALWNVPANSVGFRVKAKATDSIDLSASIFASELQQPFVYDAASSSSATYTHTGASFVGLLPTLLSGVTYSGATFSGCGEIAGTGASLTNCTISKTASTNAALSITANGSVITSTAIDLTGTSAAYHLELGTAVTAITLTDVTFTGTANNTGNQKIHVKATTGTVTITISGTTSLVAGDVTSDGALVSIDAPIITATGQIVDLVAGSRVQIYNVTASTEIYNDIVAGTSYSDTYITGTDFSVDDVVRVRVAWMDGAAAKVPVQYTTIATADGWAVLATQEDDAVYNLNAIDGDTVTEFVADYPHVQIDIDDHDGGTTPQRGYAWYIAGQMTADGIAYYHGAMTAEDEGNYRINVDTLDLKLQNISASPVFITGARLYRSDGSRVTDTGTGNIEMEYGRVFTTTISTSDAVISGTAQQIIDAIPSAATIANEVVNVVVIP